MKRLIAGGVIAAALTAVAVAAAGPTSADVRPDVSGPVTLTDRGLVRGVAHGDHLTYEGIPYAAAPVGALRWKAPQRAAAWPGIRDASKPGASCAQVSGTAMAGSEDCLFINVTTPARPGALRPVMVWVHGGGFTQGSGSDYDTANFAARGDAVVVTVNYRLGVFGFFGHPALRGEGDFGLQDQQAALRWVKRNAVFFGGNPANVTLFGESAGGMSTCSQLAAPAARGLFAKAIIQSGSCRTQFPRNGLAPGIGVYDPWQPTTAVEASGTTMAGGLGCSSDVLACLRAVPASQLVTPDLMNTFSFVAYGTKTLPQKPSAALEAGNFAKVPVLQGTNRDEMRLYVGFVLASGYTIDQTEYARLLKDSFASHATTIARAYPATTYGTPALAWAAALTDAGWTCRSLDAGRALARHVPVWAYDFTDRTAPNTQGVPETPAFPVGAAHGSELAYLFSLVDLNPQQTTLSNQMMGLLQE